MKANLRNAVALTLGACTLAANVMAANVTFTDVPKGHWAYDKVTQAANQSLVAGLGDGTYGVDMKLSNAHFTVMICNLFYKDSINLNQNSGDWWRPYLDTAYAKGVLVNTTAGEQRANAADWTAAMANADINRYDMAQIMLNILKNQGWDSPTVVDLASASTKIADWKSIPTKYQTAVATAYAKGYLSGMDSVGTFMGDYSVTRAQGAVVLCTLMDAKNKVDAPVYTNTTKLLNGKSATQDNVYDALDALKDQYAQNLTWDTSRTYTSAVLGSGKGSQAFAYTLSDKVFGAMKATKVSDPDDLKVGDMVYLNSADQYLVVTDVEKGEFDYVTCSDSNGLITWRGSGDVDDLGKKDIIYTRYTATSSSSSSNKLANGKSATEKNVYNALMDLKDDYDQGDTWDMDQRYRTDVFGSCYGSEAFAGYLSDEIFGDLEAEEHTKHENVKVGDIVYLYDDDEYVIVVQVDKNSFTYATVSTKGKITWKDSAKFDDLDKKDIVYTRYPDGSASDSLTNGKSVTEKNVSSLLWDLEDDYSDGDSWDMNSRYRSDTFGSAYGSEAFSYFISDKIFGDLDYTKHTKSSQLRVGDVVYLDEYEDYVIVVEVNSTKFTYAGVSSKGKIFWDGTYKLSDISKSDAIYTRYLDDTGDDTLTNGKAATEKNVFSMLEQLYKDYEPGDIWEDDVRYRSDTFGSAYGCEAFSYFISDKVFGDLDYTKHTDHEDAKSGDVIYLSDYENYYLVVEVDDDELVYAGVNSKDKIFWNGRIDLDDLGKKDVIYTRYP